MLRYLCTVALAAAVAVSLAACTSRPERTIDDPAFVRSANALCAEELPPLRAERKDTDAFGSTPKSDRAEVAARVEQVADALDEVAIKLGELPLRPADQGEVAGWLEEWTNYTGIGRQYAKAVRTEKASVYTAIAEDGADSVRRIAKFARANRIDKCIL